MHCRWSSWSVAAPLERETWPKPAPKVPPRAVQQGTCWLVWAAAQQQLTLPAQHKALEVQTSHNYRDCTTRQPIASVIVKYSQNLIASEAIAMPQTHVSKVTHPNHHNALSISIHNRFVLT